MWSVAKCIEQTTPLKTMDNNLDFSNEQEAQAESTLDEILNPVTGAENAPESDLLGDGEQPVLADGEGAQNAAEEAEQETTAQEEQGVEPVAPSAAERRRRAVRRAAGRIDNSERSVRAIALNQIRREANASMGSKHVYRGKVIVAQPANDNAPALVQVQLGNSGLSVVISYADFFSPDPLRTDLPAGARANRELRLLNNTWGANVPFVITDMIEGDDNAVMIRASRKDALPILQRINYFSGNDNNNIKQGRIVNAEILSVDGAGHTMWVELGGVEQRLFPSMITYRPIVNATDLNRMGYAAGHQVPVYVERLELDPETRTVKELRVNAAIAELAKWERGMNMLQPGTRCQGTITSFHSYHDGHYFCHAWVDGVNAPVRVVGFPRFNGNIAPGQKAQLAVTGINPEDNYGLRVYCRVLRIFGT